MATFFQSLPTFISYGEVNLPATITKQTWLNYQFNVSTYPLIRDKQGQWVMKSGRRSLTGYTQGLDYVTFEPGPRVANRGDLLFDIYTPVRASDMKLSSTGSGPKFATDGINIKTFAEGNDLIYPNGRGYSDFFSFYSWEETIVDKGTTWVNPGNGIDVVVGGYGYDLIGSRNTDTLNTLWQNTGRTSASTAKGSKFYVGGSSKDVLDGGNDADYLIGDRFNDYELYIPRSALDANIAGPFEPHKQVIASYQPPSWTQSNTDARFGTASKGKDRLGVTKLKGTFSGSNFPLWIPGNDVIHGYGGDDVLYGDDNAEDNLSYLNNIRRYAGNINLPWNSGLRLGDDFINGGDGNDQIFGGFGSDAIIGGKGSDFISVGDQIVAGGFEPLWGPKIVWGDEYDPKDREYSPDTYLIGEIFSTSNSIEESRSGISDTSQLRKTMAEQMQTYEEQWKNAGKIIKLIPKVGSIISALGDLFFAYAKSHDKKVPSTGNAAKPLDALTVIKDFDPTDQLVVRLAPGESLKEYRTGNIYTVNSFGYDKINKLAKNIGGDGWMISYAKGSSEQYERVFLQGYTGSLVKLKEETDPNGGLLVFMGGSDYANLPVA